MFPDDHPRRQDAQTKQQAAFKIQKFGVLNVGHRGIFPDAMRLFEVIPMALDVPEPFSQVFSDVPEYLELKLWVICLMSQQTSSRSAGHR